MLFRRVLLPFLSILLMLTSLSATPWQGQDPSDVLTFDNGYSIQGPFLQFWKEAPDPELMFGLPITQEMEHPIRKGVTIQFFEKVRMEFDPSQPADSRVKLADIGTWLYDETQRGDPADFPVNDSVCRTFPKTGYLVCYSFLTFYDRYNGAKYFGQPISNVELVNGRLVQYFERARMEWRSEMPVGQRVVLTEIGVLDREIQVGKVDGTGKNVLAQKTLQLKAYAFVGKPLLASGQKQQVFVVVRNQNGQPVQDVSVIVTVIYPNKSDDNTRTGQTDADGVTQLAFETGQVTPNQMVKIKVEAYLAAGPKTEAWTWFRTWW